MKALVRGNLEQVSTLLSDYINNAMSVRQIKKDEPELAYHNFFLGLLAIFRGNYHVSSNRESGHGYYDIMIIPQNDHHTGALLELKKAKSSAEEDLIVAAKKGIEQIEAKRYWQEAVQSKCIENLFIYGIGIYSKKIAVEMKKIVYG